MVLRECDARQDCGAFLTLHFWNKLETIRIVFYILGITFLTVRIEVVLKTEP